MDLFDHLIKTGNVVDAIQTIGLVVIAIYGFGIRRAMNNFKELQALDGVVDEIGVRITALEQSAKHAPTHGDLAAIYNRLNGMSDGLSEMRGTLDGVRRGQERIEEYLLNRKD